MLVMEVVDPFYITGLKCGGQGILVSDPLKATEGFAFFEGEGRVLGIAVWDLILLLVFADAMLKERSTSAYPMNILVEKLR